MTVVNRRVELCDQSPLALTGIDFVRVVDHEVQDLLWVFFIVDPTVLTIPMVDAGLLTAPAAGDDAGPPIAAGTDVRIDSVDGAGRIEVEATRWRLVRTEAGIRSVLEVEVAAPGGFEDHLLLVDDDRVDPFFNAIRFNFKQGCPSPFDCQHEPSCRVDDRVEVAIDYLARDFDSYRQVLLDFATSRFPGWSEPLEADIAVMLMEIMAALGDEFAYLQDRYAREASFAAATQRRSLSALARLVDYEVDPGSPGTTELAVWVDDAIAPDGAQTASGMQVWASVLGQPPITFTVTKSAWHHPAWNEIPLHCADRDEPVLAFGATSAYLATAAPTAAQIDPDSDADENEAWIGRRVLLRDVPVDPAEPVLVWPVTITGVERLDDQLILTDGSPTPLTCISWNEDEATPFPMSLTSTSALLNIVPVVAGEAQVEYFRVGTNADVLGKLPGLTAAEIQEVLALPRAVEREGPWDPEAQGRGAVVRYGLRASESVGLGWIGDRDPLGLGADSTQVPRITVTEVIPPTFVAREGADWSFARDLLESDLGNAVYTVEEGVWRTTVRHQTVDGHFDFGDYASNDGWSIRFGDGPFGRSPDPGTVLRAEYYSAPGADGNVGPDAISLTALPNPPASATPIPHALAVTNPMAVTDGTNEETAASVRIRAPQAYRALPLRAVRPEDYQSIVERLDFVQRAHSLCRFTGTWTTDFVTADPRNGFELTEGELAALSVAVDRTRQAGRDVCVTQPDYLDVDVEVTVCIEPSSYPGEVVPRIVEALESPGLFNPDNFTFGQPLRRSVIEATVQGIPGVLAVDKIRLRVRGRTDWHVFVSPELPAAASQIIRVQNDPSHPGRGSISVLLRGSES